MPSDHRFGVVKPTELPREQARKPGRVAYPARTGNLAALLRGALEARAKEKAGAKA